jgi:hypothetical protein
MLESMEIKQAFQNSRSVGWIYFHSEGKKSLTLL